LILEQVVAGGIDDVAVVVSPGQQQMLERYFAAAASIEGWTFPSRVLFVEQISPRGFGDAVLCGVGFVGREPFLVLLGDHIQIADEGARPCVLQVIDAFTRVGGTAMVGVHEVPASELSKIGVAKGEPLGDRVYRCVDFVEKPNVETAGRRLRTPGLREGVFLGHCGIYVFSSEIFDCLQEEVRDRNGSAGEVELAAAQQRLLRRHPMDYHLVRIAGRAYDTGTPEGYLATLQAVGNGKDE
jgi:UTP--glucose-1-phosphate uridylyltransferase